jgi:hypothetical protein
MFASCFGRLRALVVLAAGGLASVTLVTTSDWRRAKQPVADPELDAERELPERELLIRLAGRGDDVMLQPLAVLDSQAPLDGDVLIAELDGVVVAALSLQDGRLIADPFAPTAAVGDHLRLRGASIRSQHRRSSAIRRLLRLIPAPQEVK